MVLPLIYFLCQCDLSPWAVSRDQVDRFSKENGFTGWTETSVKENKNINEAMRWVAYAVLEISIQIYPSFTAVSWTFLFLSKQEQIEPMECRLLKARGAVFSPEIIGDNEAFKPCGFTECHLVTKHNICCFSIQFLRLIFYLIFRVLIEKMMSNSREDMSLSTQGNYINLQTKPSSSWACC